MKRLLFFVVAIAGLVLASGARADAARGAAGYGAAALSVQTGSTSAATFATGPLVQISASSPFVGCTGDNVSSRPRL